MKYNKNPGPGTYDTTALDRYYGSSSSKLAVFGTQQRNTIQSFHTKNSKTIVQEPGPGAYDYNNGVGKVKNVASTKFGTAERVKNSSKLLSPGPGQYTQLHQYGQGGLKFTGRPATTKANDGPGPASYE